jgi:LemA protein
MEPMDTFIARRIFAQLGGIIAIAAILGGFIVAYNATYAGVANLEQEADARWEAITRDMAERYAGIPNATAGLGISPGSDAGALEDVTRNLGRWNEAISEGDMGRINRATTDLEESLSQLTLILKRHPGIAASGKVQDLLEVLERTEGAVSADRSSYNEGVREYNHALGSFPASLWTENWGFARREYFTARIGSTEPLPSPVE